MVVVIACAFLLPLVVTAWIHHCQLRHRTLNDVLPYLRRDHTAELEDLLDPMVEESLRLNLTRKDFRKEQFKRIHVALECIPQRARSANILQEWANTESDKSLKTHDEEVRTLASDLKEACAEYRMGAWLICIYLRLWRLKMVLLPFTAIPKISCLRNADSFGLLHSYTRITQLAEGLALVFGGDCRDRLMHVLDHDQERSTRVLHLDIVFPNDAIDTAYDRSSSLATQTAGNAGHFERFAPGFYFGDGTVHVNLREFMKEYGIRDVHEVRAVLWSDIKSEFRDMPVQQLYDS